MSGLGKTVGKFLQRFGITAPWKITGPVSTPEYATHLTRATEYRAVSPGSFPVKPAVPYSEPETVYDVRYYTRDSRRSDANIKVKKRSWTMADVNEAAEGGKVMSKQDRKVYAWSEPKSILDTENNGYTV